MYVLLLLLLSFRPLLHKEVPKTPSKNAAGLAKKVMLPFSLPFVLFSCTHNSHERVKNPPAADLPISYYQSFSQARQPQRRRKNRGGA